MKTIGLDIVFYIHELTVKEHGGKQGIKDINQIKSALETPFLTFGGEDLNKTILDKISAMTYSFICNHGFTDGNKRVGVMIMGLLCEMNGIELNASIEDLVEFGLNVAAGKINKEDIKNWIVKYTI